MKRNCVDDPEVVTIRVADRTTTPGPRLATDGAHSGEWYRNKYLLAPTLTAIKTGGRVVVDLDGTAGYAASFLEEVFGGLVRAVWRKRGACRSLLNFVIIKCVDEPELVGEVEGYIKDVEQVFYAARKSSHSLTIEFARAEPCVVVWQGHAAPPPWRALAYTIGGDWLAFVPTVLESTAIVDVIYKSGLDQHRFEVEGGVVYVWRSS